MLKRIAYLGRPPKALKEAMSSADPSTVQFIALKDCAKPSAGVAAVVGSAEGIVEAAIAIASRHEALLHLVAEAVDCRESFRPGSSRRLAEHAARFGAALGLSVDDRFTLERGALIRDIGKLEIPNEVLLKDSLLDYDEWTMIRKHTHLGADLVKLMGGLSDTEEIVRRHHECYDGDGYPDRLEGEEIPYLARIMKVLDCYCAMTSPRRYRQSYASHEDAIAHLKAERGKHFDPELVDVFVASNVGRPETAPLSGD